jgi:hypothetical protein
MQKKFPVIPVILGLLVFGVVAVVGGFGFAASQEEHDSFCSSCHSQPESTFYQRSTAGQAVDLASYHTGQQTHCIDCHSGAGLPGRISAEVMGARNAVKWYTGTAVQPAVLSFPIGDQNCLKCHDQVTQRGYTPKQQITISGGGERGEGGGEAGTGHWHRFMARWQGTAKDAGTCVSCHTGHSDQGTAQSGYMDSQTVRNECEACHRVLRQEEGG